MYIDSMKISQLNTPPYILKIKVKYSKEDLLMCRSFFEYLESKCSLFLREIL